MQTETLNPSELLQSLESIQAGANRLVRQVEQDQWELPTPCTEWNVAQLVNHITGSINVLASAARREQPDKEPNDDHSGNDPVGALTAATESSWAAWNSPGVLDGMVSIPGDMPATVCLGITIIDTGTHLWDLAQAIGADHGLSHAEVARIDSLNRMIVNDDVRAGGGFGEELSPSSNDPLESMLAFVGRRG